MEPTEIPQPPTDALFYKWLAGIAITALCIIFSYMAHGVVAGIKALGNRLTDVEKNQIKQEAKNEIVEKDIKDLNDRLTPVEAKVHSVHYPRPGYRPEDWK